MGNGASSTPYKLSNSKHVKRDSKDYRAAMARVQGQSADPGKQTREGYRYVTGDTLVESPQAGWSAGGSTGRDLCVITDGETLLFADGTNPYLVARGDGADASGDSGNPYRVTPGDQANPARGRTGTEHLIHVEVDGHKGNVPQERAFMVGV